MEQPYFSQNKTRLVFFFVYRRQSRERFRIRLYLVFNLFILFSIISSLFVLAVIMNMIVPLPIKDIFKGSRIYHLVRFITWSYNLLGCFCCWFLFLCVCVCVLYFVAVVELKKNRGKGALSFCRVLSFG